MTDAQIPTNESTPYLVMISSNVAREALPEKGRNSIRGKSPEGMPIKSKTGDKIEEIYPSAPDATNIETETISAHIEGRRETAPVTPDFAPLKKLEK